MDTLKRTIDQIQRQLSQLNTSQRVAIALCAVIVGGSLLWLMEYAGQPEMVAVLAQDLSPGEIEEAIRTLRSEGIEARQSGSRVYVQPIHRSRALMVLGRNNILPEDTSVGFSELMAESDPFRPAAENAFRRRVALGNELARIISTSPEVQSARVIIQDVSKRRIGAGANIKPTASVYVTMARGAALTQPAVEALCRFVAGAVAGLSPTDVVVVDAVTMQPRRIPTAEEAASMGQLAERKRNEQHLAGKLLAALRSIPGVLVTVSVELDPSKTVTTRQTWDKPAIKSEESTTTTTTSGGGGAAESGVNANVGVALTANQPGNSSEAEESRSEFHEPKSKELTQIEKPPFSPVRATASIGIPRSFLVGIYRARYGDDVEPSALDDEKRFVDLRSSEVNRVRSAAMKILMTEQPEDVDVEVFFDLAGDGKSLREVATLAGEAAPGGLSVMDYVRRYGAASGLVVLALVSFMMMGRMVRKSSQITEQSNRRAAPEKSGPEEILRVGAGPVGQAEESDGMLVGREIDDATIRHQQLAEQIAQMVGEHPKQAAELVRHWAEATEK